MAARKLTEEQIERACILRETGLSSTQIASKLGLAVSQGALDWHFLIRGADPPGARPPTDPYRQAGQECQRGNHTVRRFTREEDTLMLAMSGLGKNPSEIGRVMNPARRPNSITGRLATLARHAERAESV